MSAHAASDAIIYRPNAVRVGVLLFGERKCATCGRFLPANTDYYAPEKRTIHQDGAQGCQSECRQCKRARDRAGRA